MARIPAANRPHYTPEERFEILSLRAPASWSVATTARVFQVAAGTIVTWARRLDEGGSAALLALPVPVNKLPECHSLVVEQLRALLPTMGKRRIAQLLTRAGVSLAAIQAHSRSKTAAEAAESARTRIAADLARTTSLPRDPSEASESRVAR